MPLELSSPEFGANSQSVNHDPNGLWLVWGHNAIIEDAFPGLSQQQRQILKDSSVWVDSYKKQSQEAMHGMDSAYDDGTYDAAGKSHDWIEKNERAAKDEQAAWIASGHEGISPNALAAFGNALHTVTDEYSPAHEGFQSVKGVGYVRHILREGPIRLHPQREQAAASAGRREFLNVFGAVLAQAATGERVTSVVVHWGPVIIYPK